MQIFFNFQGFELDSNIDACPKIMFPTSFHPLYTSWRRLNNHVEGALMRIWHFEKMVLPLFPPSFPLIWTHNSD